MFVELETLASNLVASGLLRIDADDRQNFVRLSLPYDDIEMAFSRRELLDEARLEHTHQRILQALVERHGDGDWKYRIIEEISRLRDTLEKRLPVSPEDELKLARILVQSAHPVLIHLLLEEKVEVFVSYSNNIGDMLDVFAWQQVGGNNGMQSTDGRQSAVFISCCGDPLSPIENEGEIGNGFPALARMMVIAGQELGHYADLIRDEHGRKVDRHSANIACTHAKGPVALARQQDMAAVAGIQAQLEAMKLPALVEQERQLQFFATHRARSLTYWRRRALHVLRLRFFWQRCQRAGLGALTELAHTPWAATRLAMMLEDMAFNLAPEAPSYEREEPGEAEAIACAEALARVPQQVVKWGHDITHLMWPELYPIYYGAVIPDCIRAYEQRSGMQYKPEFTPPKWSVMRKIKKIVNALS